MNKRECIMCGQKVSSGRKFKRDDEIICNGKTCWGEWFLNKTDYWGRM